MTLFGNCSCYANAGVYPPDNPVIGPFFVGLVDAFDVVSPFVTTSQTLSRVQTNGETVTWDATFQLGTQIRITRAVPGMIETDYVPFAGWWDLGVTSLRVQLLDSFLGLYPQSFYNPNVIVKASIQLANAAGDAIRTLISVESGQDGLYINRTYGGFPLKQIGGVWAVDRDRVVFPQTFIENQSTNIIYIPETNYRFREIVQIQNGIQPASWRVVPSPEGGTPLDGGSYPGGASRIEHLNLC